MNALRTTPIHRLPFLGRSLGIDLWIKRDDLFPITGGGNKARKIAKIFASAEKEKANAVITTGGLQSNHARVTALMAAQHHWPCHLILHGSREHMQQPAGNLQLMLLAGGNIQLAEPSKIAEGMVDAVKTLRAQGYMPYEIPGGGHSIDGGMAYVEAAEELWHQCEVLNWYPDFIVLASGTGTTQAGLIVGFEHLGTIRPHIIGISVARKNPYGCNVVTEMSEILRCHLQISSSKAPVDFRDEWIGDGYEKAGPNVLRNIRSAAQKEGLILDPTYTGKAFTGLLALAKRKEIPPGSKVLFWHTGGLLNLMASRYSFNESV